MAGAVWASLHYLFLPAMRMGIGEEFKLPDYIPTRGHLMLQNQKISKSRNWYIGLKDFTVAFNPDYLRFYIASIVTYSQDDLNFDFGGFAEKINNELIANVGNFVNRALSFTQKAFAGKVPEPGQLDAEDRAAVEEVATAVAEVGRLIQSNETDKALKRIMALSSLFNQYFQKKKPWSDAQTAPATLVHLLHIIPSFAFRSSISFASIFLKIGSTLPSAWPGCTTFISAADCHDCSWTLPCRPSWLHIFSHENGIKGASSIASDLAAFAAT